MKRILKSCTAAVVGLFCLTSCKKNSDDASLTNCRLATTHLKTGIYDATTALTYDTSSRLIATTTQGTASKVRNFTYRGDTITIKEISGTSLTTYKAVRNSKGNLKALTAYQTNDSTRINFTVRYDYNSSGRVFSQTTTYGTAAPTVYTLSYNVAGDAISAINPATPSSPAILYEFLTERDFELGDPSAIINYLDYGTHAVTNTHLLRKVTAQNTVVTTYAYTFGMGTRISRVVATSGDSTSTYDYTYTCK